MLKPALAVDTLAAHFVQVRALSLALAAPLSDADATVQSMPDASPAKWHLAHTTWFFETFVLRDHLTGYRVHDERWPFLFNSYYEAEGERHARDHRGMVTRPALDEVRAYRAHVDAALVAALPRLPAAAAALVELGCQHEQQHQELLVTDLLHLFSRNPLEPALYPAHRKQPVAVPPPVGWIEQAGGVVEIGHGGTGFAFDCETPRHPALLAPHAIADRTVTNAEWADFIADGGYRTARWWLADGWAWIQRERVAAAEGRERRQRDPLHDRAPGDGEADDGCDRPRGRRCGVHGPHFGAAGPPAPAIASRTAAANRAPRSA